MKIEGSIVANMEITVEILIALFVCLFFYKRLSLALLLWVNWKKTSEFALFQRYPQVFHLIISWTKYHISI
jgi:hypothetical protein